ncbi:MULTISPECIES: ADYC domain-containing protein [unclassified Rhizobium]|uniref:ADYC domain-containing protein n=1 Tax=unclassified Rhizobium TaxID=2613769 RepID=UPI0007EE3EC9|nr:MULTISPECIES: ADYC domain-containing protein [unclassified Rhizobium]ANM21850.1 hypothetical protein AMK07_CH00517 [Rhizobium sp. N941]
MDTRTRRQPRLIVVAWTLLFCAAVASSSLPAAATASLPERIEKTEVVGTAFRLTFSSGRVLQGKELTGVTLSLLLSGDPVAHRVRIDDVVTDSRDPDGEVLLHKVSVADGAAPVELCDPDPDGNRWMFPLKGQWDSEGKMISQSGFTLTCSAGAQGKCVRFGYKPWKTLSDGTDLAEYHRACVKMVRADYCGDHATTRTGMKIDIYDDRGIQREAESSGSDELSFEAAWSPAGAVCVAHTRVPEKMTLDGLSHSCPRLADRLGATPCTAQNAEAGLFGKALLFNRSR